MRRAVTTDKEQHRFSVRGEFGKSPAVAQLGPPLAVACSDDGNTRAEVVNGYIGAVGRPRRILRLRFIVSHLPRRTSAHRYGPYFAMPGPIGIEHQFRAVCFP